MATLHAVGVLGGLEIGDVGLAVLAELAVVVEVTRIHPRLLGGEAPDWQSPEQPRGKARVVVTNRSGHAAYVRETFRAAGAPAGRGVEETRRSARGERGGPAFLEARRASRVHFFASPAVPSRPRAACRARATTVHFAQQP